MKTVKNTLRYLLVAFYIFMGSMHFLKPEQYDAMMPSWLPSHSLLILVSGVAEIILGILLIPLKTRAISAKLIIAMLILFLLVIHIPQSVVYYKTGNQDFIASILRLPFQFLLIWWAWLFSKDKS